MLILATLKIGYNMINLYMHEVALHSKTAADQLRPPFNADTFKDGVLGSEPLSAAHISAISACLGAVDGMFTTFLGMDVSDIRTLPAYNFVRVAYGIVILVKMYFSASSPGSELGKVINKSNLRVEHYLDALLDKFHRTAADDRSKPAAKFLVVLAMLKSWFIKQERHDGKGSAGDALSQPGGRPRQESSSQPRPQSANTPLQLLSEVAAGSDANRARAAFSSVSNIHQTPQPLFHDTTAPSSTASPELQQQQQQHQVHPFTNPSAHWTPSSQQQPAALPMDMTLMGSATGLDFTDLGFTPEGQEGGAHIMLSEPWFSDVFQGFQSMQDTNTMFPF